MYWYMYRTCIGRDPTVQYLKKGIRDTIFGVSYPTFVPRSAAGVYTHKIQNTECICLVVHMIPKDALA